MMTKLLQDAIKKVKELPDNEQEAVAVVMLEMAAAETPLVHLDDETRAAVREGTAQARRGEFVSDKDMKAFFKRHGV